MSFAISSFESANPGGQKLTKLVDMTILTAVTDLLNKLMFRDSAVSAVTMAEHCFRTT